MKRRINWDYWCPILIAFVTGVGAGVAWFDLATNRQEREVPSLRISPSYENLKSFSVILDKRATGLGEEEPLWIAPEKSHLNLKKVNAVLYQNHVSIRVFYEEE